MWILKLPAVLISGVTATVGFVCIYKDIRSGPAYDKKARCDGKVAIVTGANSGIGKATTVELANRGAKVFMACRDMTKCEEARREIVLSSENKFVYCRYCDLGSLASVRKFVERFKSEEPELHYLVNNAGIMGVPKGVTREGFESHLGVNYFGHFVLTSLLLDTLKKSQPSRIVFLSDEAHKKGKIHTDDLNLDKEYDPNEAYNQSKLANVLFARELGKRLLETKVSVVVVDPGLSTTDLQRHLPMTKSITSYLIYPIFWPFMKNPRSASQVVIHALLDKTTANSSGDYFVDMTRKEPSETAQDYELSLWLWKVSEKWTKVQPLV